MIVAITEFKNNLSKYLKISQDEEILITKYGKVVSKLAYACEDKTKIIESLIGCLKISDEEYNELLKDDRARHILKIS